MARPQSSERTKTLLILSLLEQGDKTGFELIYMMGLRREFAFLAEEGMIYPILHDMEQRQLISSYEKKTEAGVRRFYRVKKQGMHFLSNLKRSSYKPQKVGGGVCAKSEDEPMAK